MHETSVLNNCHAGGHSPSALKTGVMLVGKIPLHETKFSDDKTDRLTGPCLWQVLIILYEHNDSFYSF